LKYVPLYESSERTYPFVVNGVVRSWDMRERDEAVDP